MPTSHYTTSDRVTPVVRSHNFGTFDPTPQHWTTLPDRALSEPDTVALRVEFDRLAHELDVTAARQRRAEALERQVIDAVGAGNYHHYYSLPQHRRAASALDYPDPERWLAKKQRYGGPRKRYSPAQLRAKRRENSAALLASAGNPRDLTRRRRANDAWAREHDPRDPFLPENRGRAGRPSYDAWARGGR